MSIWQNDFSVLPTAEILTLKGKVPLRLEQGDSSRLRGLIAKDVVRGFLGRFERWRPEFKSWNSDLRWWGSEESDRIDVWFKNDGIESITFRVELRRLDIPFIQLMVDFARETSCMIYSLHTRELIEPVRERVLGHLIKSNGVNEVWDFLRDPTMLMERRKASKVFLSHSSLDKAFVGRLAIDLREKNVPVWYDKWELKVGDSLTEKISEGISDSSWLAVVLSKNSVSSQWVKKELNAALAIELEKRNVFVLPIMLDDCEIPVFLKDKLYADFRSTYEDGLHSLLDRLLDTHEFS